MLNIFYHRSTAIVFRIVLFDTLWKLWKLLFFEENIFEVFLYLCFFDPKTSNFHNSEMIGRRKQSDPSVNNIFNVLSTGLQNKLSFKWTNFGLKCLVTETDRNCNSVFKLVDGNWVIMEQKRKMEYSWACTFRASQRFSQSGFLKME